MQRSGLVVVLSLFVLLGRPTTSQADIITEYTTAGVLASAWAGQSFTTPDGGPWDNITFSFLFIGTPVAAGTLYLLEEAVAAPSDLSTSAPGFLAQSQSIVSNVYVFDPSLVLSPNTQYFAYSSVPVLISYAAGYSGGAGGWTFLPGDPYGTNYDANFSVKGELVQEVPEAASLLLLGTGLAGAVVRRRLRRTPRSA